MIYIDLSVKQITDFLFSVNSNKCPCCGHEWFKVLSFGNDKPSIRDTLEIMMTLQPNGMLEVKPSPLRGNTMGATVQVICTKCGNVRNYNYFALCEAIAVQERNKHGTAQ